MGADTECSRCGETVSVSSIRSGDHKCDESALLERIKELEERVAQISEPEWYEVKSGPKNVEMSVLVVAGRVASYSWGSTYVGREWSAWREELESKGYRIWPL